jgi:putative membrane protein
MPSAHAGEWHQDETKETMTIADLPTLNATLNAAATLFLLAGYLFIRNGDAIRHRASMAGALLMSAAFLTSYLVYHYHAGSVPFQGQGVIRVVYFTILITHIILAAAILPLVLITVRYALTARFASHRRLARWTWPIWMYVSVTGVVIYLMLYKM